MSKQNEAERPGLRPDLVPNTRLIVAGRDPTSFQAFVHPPVADASARLYRDATGGRRGAPPAQEHFQAKWEPVRRPEMRKRK